MLDQLIQKLLWVAVYAASITVKDATRCRGLANIAVSNFKKAWGIEEEE